MKYSKTTWLLGWIGIWIVFWLTIGNFLPQHPHIPFIGMIAPILVPYSAISGELAFSYTYFLLEDLPFIVFWLVFILIFLFKKNKNSKHTTDKINQHL